MKIIYVFFSACLIFVLLAGCEPNYSKEYPKPVIVLPNEETENNVNGYKDETNNNISTESTESTSDETKYSGRFIGNKNSKKYHTTSCRYAKSLKEENMIIFNTFDEAKSAGYSACSVCGN